VALVSVASAKLSFVPESACETISVFGSEVPPPEGFITVIAGEGKAAETISEAGIDAESRVALTNVVSRALPFTFTTDPRTKLWPVTVSVKAGPPVATMLGEMESIVGTTPIPDSGTSIFPRPGFENVISRVAVSTAGSEAVNVMPNAHEANEASEDAPPRLQAGVGGLTADEGAPSLKSAELADGRMAKLVTLRLVDPLPSLNSVPSASMATPFGTLPKDMGLGKHPVSEQEPRKPLVPCVTLKSGMGPFTVPERKRDGSRSVPVSPSLTVSVALRKPAGAKAGGLNCKPNQQDAAGATLVA
jgi:hypothetical protein